MSQENHPVWFVLKALVIFAFAFLFSYTNANDFDETEYNMLLQLGAVLFGGHSTRNLLEISQVISFD